MPTHLNGLRLRDDRAFSTENQLRLEITEDIYDFIIEQADGSMAFLIGGDLNETWWGEGWPLRHKGDGRKLVEEFLDDERTYADLHRKAWGTDAQPTRVPNVATHRPSRIDFLVVPTRSCDAQDGTWQHAVGRQEWSPVVLTVPTFNMISGALLLRRRGRRPVRMHSLPWPPPSSGLAPRLYAPPPLAWPPPRPSPSTYFYF